MTAFAETDVYRTDGRVEAAAQAARQELSRRRLLDYATAVKAGYQRPAHLELVAEHLEALEAREIRRLLIEAPPRHGKSETAARLFPSWYLGRRPSEHVIVASYAAELAEAHSRAARGYLGAPGWPFPGVQVSADSRAVGRWATTAGGGLRAVGLSSGVTGHGAHLLLADDLIRGAADADSQAVRDATWTWWTTDVLSRLEPDGVICAIGTRWHEDDPLGRILNSPGASEWVVVRLPAIAEDDDLLGREVGEPLWVERFGCDHYESKREELGPRAWAALFQQRPVRVEGAIFEAGWLTGTYEMLPDGCRSVLGVDSSFGKGVGSDYSALVSVAADGRYFYVTDVRRGRWQFHELMQQIEAAAPGHSHVLIEDSAAGQSAIQELRRTTSLPVIPVPAKVSKTARAEQVTGTFEAGRVLFPQVSPPWKHDLLDELGSFPTGKHDDQVDALVYALSKLRGSRSAAGVSAVIVTDRQGNPVEADEPQPGEPSRRGRAWLAAGEGPPVSLSEDEREAFERERIRTHGEPFDPRYA